VNSGMAILCPLCGGKFVDIRIYTPKEAAQMIGVAEKTIMNWIRAGELDARVWSRGKIGPCKYVIDSHDLEKFINWHLPRRSELAPDAENWKAQRAYRLLRFRRPPEKKRLPK